jgi:hypothetical protein
MQPRLEPVSPIIMTLHVIFSQADLDSQAEETQAHVPPAQDVVGPQVTTAATTMFVSEQCTDATTPSKYKSPGGHASHPAAAPACPASAATTVDLDARKVPNCCY